MARYPARQPSHWLNGPPSALDSSIPPSDPLSSAPLTAPRRRSATSPAAIGPITGATTVLTPARVPAARSTPKSGAAAAASSMQPAMTSRPTASRRCLTRSPSGTSAKSPSA